MYKNTQKTQRNQSIQTNIKKSNYKKSKYTKLKYTKI